MQRIELENYLDSLKFGIDEEKILKEYKPTFKEVGGEQVYLFNKGFDITDLPIEENVSISQQPHDSAIPLHMHDYIEMMFVYRGTCTVKVKGKKIDLKKGELILINKETPHSVGATTEQDIVINMILKQDYLSPSFLSRFSQKSIISQFMIESLLSNRKQNHFLIFRPGEHNNVIEIMENIMCEFFDRDFCSGEIIDSYLIVLFSTLIRYKNNLTSQEPLNQNDNSSLVDFLRYIEENYKNCSLVKMGQTFGFNPNYLSTLLKKGTGKSFKELLQIQRLNQAALFLSNSDLPIPEIAEEVGYSSVTFFYKKFRDLYHDTPYSYREKNSIL
ncbi:AraC-like DNA-binding protein/mannose-6-phosphate isomerase-like protein (cupin superfamily) [Neobacillus niacini]|uniref:AraC family transcriptional regulator n=1 Tax=Neobacillus driksii TaxID=3035913 RepID=UPI002783880A|nr:AraC family transcriptional regulator [Neobacillus niacini]MDQ0972051.1 AraC-like DNA-binding protein/mannose-6-phosphate isomerase-like protein (cupin superfamily) [Neobacillus niacini]